jgi:hypothetical protein
MHRRCKCEPAKDSENPIKDLESLRKKIESMEGPEWIWRGVGKAKYSLHSALDRTIETRGWDERTRPARWLEIALWRKFAREVHERGGVPENTSVMETIALMRHHGAPTRLLDWSYSPWIALYFAAVSAADRGIGEQDNVALWVVDANWLKSHSREVHQQNELSREAFLAYEDDLHCRKAGTFGALYNARNPVPCVLKQNSWGQNARLIAQQGVFLCPTDVSRCFHGNLAAMGPLTGHVHKLEFSPKLVPDIIRHLYRYGITQASLYPGIDGFARSLADLVAIPDALGGSDLKFNGLDVP